MTTTRARRAPRKHTQTSLAALRLSYSGPWGRSTWSQTSARWGEAPVQTRPAQKPHPQLRPVYRSRSELNSAHINCLMETTEASVQL